MKRPVAVALPLVVALGALVAALTLWMRPTPEAHTARPEGALGRGAAVDNTAGELREASDLDLPSLWPTRTLPASDPTPAGNATLVVHAVSDYTGRDLPNVRVTVRPSDGERVRARAVRGSVARLGEAPLTDGEGMVEIEVPADRAWTISVASEGLGHGAADATTPGLAAGERRVVTARVPALGDLEFFVAAVDGASGDPIAGARVSGIEPAQTGPDGIAGVLVASWRRDKIHVSAPGYRPEELIPAKGHEAPESALVVRLFASAALIGTVRSVDGQPLQGVSVGLRAIREPKMLPRDSLSFTIQSSPSSGGQDTTRSTGTFRVNDLPSGVPLAVLISRSGKRLHGALEPIVLAAGEERRLDWTVDEGSTLTGRVVDASHRGIPDVPLRLRSADTPRTGGRRQVSDASGNFTFTGVHRGRWLLDADDELRPIHVAVEGVEVDAPEMPTLLTVTLRARVGATIRGTLVDPEGRPANGVVFASPEGSAAGVQASTAPDGSFEVGPLRPGLHRLHGSHPRFAPGIAAAAAGAEGVVIELTVGGSLAGSVVDASGAPASAMITARAAGPPWVPGVTRMTRAEAGRFSMDSVSAGTYGLVATDGIRIGCLAGVRVSEGALTEGTLVRIEEGARLRVTWDGSAVAPVAVLADDAVVIEERTLSPGLAWTCLVPAGALTVLVRTPASGEIAERAITVRAGEVRELVLGAD